MADQFAMSFSVLNYSGMLFNKGNTRTPLSSIIGSKAKVTNHVEFAIGQYFTGGSASPAQPAISETSYLTAPDATIVTRTQMTNVTQIFQECPRSPDPNQVFAFVFMNQLIGIDTHGRHPHTGSLHGNRNALISSCEPKHIADICITSGVFQIIIRNKFCPQRIARQQNCFCNVSYIRSIDMCTHNITSVKT